MSSLTDRLRRRRPTTGYDDRPRPASRGREARARGDWRASLPVALLSAAHPRHGLLVTAGLTAGAALSGRTPREVALVAATVLVGQVVLGWQNDAVDAKRDARHGRTDKPVVAGHLETGTLWFAIACGILLVVPLSVANGRIAGLTHLAILLIAMLGNAGLLRRGRFSFLPWMATFGLMPAFLSYGGWATEAEGRPPTIAMTALAALLGFGVHVLRSLPGLVDDNVEGLRTFPLRVALRLGAPRLMLLAGLWTAAVCAGIVLVALTVGLRQ